MEHVNDCNVSRPHWGMMILSCSANNKVAQSLSSLNLQRKTCDLCLDCMMVASRALKVQTQNYMAGIGAQTS